MSINVYSLDMDGCCFNLRFRSPDHSLYHDIIGTNTKLWEHIQKNGTSEDINIICLGSNRQSYLTEQKNIKENRASCFARIQDVADYLSFKFEPMLLADIYGELPFGESYLRATDVNYLGEHAPYIFDSTKATLLYAQMQKIALDYPQQQIDFNFYDDKEKILGSLLYFFLKNNGLIPDNLTLHLHHYEGDAITNVKSIRGNGYIDENFRDTVCDMAQTCKRLGANHHINAAKYVKESDLQRRQPLEFVSGNSPPAYNQKARERFSLLKPPNTHSQLGSSVIIESRGLSLSN